MVVVISERRRVTFRAIEQVQQLAALLSKRRVQLAKQAGLTEAQWRILEGIATEHFMPSMFAREQDHTPGAVSKLVRQLLTKKLIRVSISPQDGRQRDYELTAKGRKALDRLHGLREQAIEEIWGDLPIEDLQALTQVNELLISRIRDYAERQSC